MSLNPQEPYDDRLSLPTLMELLAAYTQKICLTNEMGADVAFANGCVWADTFEFRLPKALVLAEVNRMAAWCLKFQAEVEAATLADVMESAEQTERN